MARELLRAAALALALAGFASIFSCLPVMSESRCARDSDCPIGYLCDPETTLCRAGDAGVADAATLDAPGVDASGLDAARLDTSLLDTSRSDIARPDTSGSQVAVRGFYASPPRVEYGSGSTLHWVVEHATACALDGEPVDVSMTAAGQRAVAPRASRTYELLCEGPGGPVVAEAELEIRCAAPAEVDLGTDYHFASRAELDAEFEGLGGCFKIVGDLNIHHSTDIVHLDVLEGLVEVTGDVDLIDNVALTNIDGLQGLQRVGDDLFLGRYDDLDTRHYGNPALSSIAGLSGLRDVDGILQIQYSPLLRGLAGLEQLRRVGGRLLIQHMDGLSSLAALRRLGVVGTNPDEGSIYFYLADLPALESLRGLEQLTTLGDYMGLEDLPLVSDLSPLSGLSGEVTRLYVENCDALVDLRGLEGIHLSHTLWLRANQSLVDLSALSGATGSAISRVVVKDNPALSSLHGLEAITHILDGFGEIECDQAANDEQRCEGTLHLFNNALVDLDGLAGLQQVSDTVYLELNHALIDISGLSGVTDVGGRLSVVDNDQLSSLDELGGMRALGGDLHVEGNESLTALGLDPTCAFTGQRFTVVDNPELSIVEAQTLAEAWTGHDPGAYDVTISRNGP